MVNVNFPAQENSPSHTFWLTASALMILTLVMSGCGNNSPSSQIAATPTPTLLFTATETPTPTPRLNPTDTPTVVPNCSWQWANKNLPEQTETVRNVLSEAGIPVTDVNVYAFGENYVCDGQVEGFAAMDTNLRMSIVYDTDATLADLGDTVGTILTLLFETQLLNGLREVSVLIGSKSESISVSFKPGSEEFHKLYNQKVTGLELLDVLGHPTPTPTP